MGEGLATMLVSKGGMLRGLGGTNDRDQACYLDIWDLIPASVLEKFQGSVFLVVYV